MDISSIANMATQMQADKTAMQYSVAMLKESQNVEKMLAQGAVDLIQSADINGDAGAKAQGRGTLLNTTA